MEPPPTSIIIIGSGVFGLSTAYSLATNPRYGQTTITVVDRSSFPNPSGSSIDSSRIIRSDYSNSLYAALAAKAQKLWELTTPGSLGADGRYSPSGLLLTCHHDAEGAEYVKRSYANVQSLVSSEHLTECLSQSDVKRLAGTAGGSGSYGYLNKTSGWADAEASMLYLRSQVEATGRVNFLIGTVQRLLYSPDLTICTGAKLTDGEEITAHLTIVAAGAWSPTLVNLRGRAEATGQAIAYMKITDEEQERLKDIPIMLSFTSGMFIIPPRNNILKVARHAFGYLNKQLIDHPDPKARAKNENALVEISTPSSSMNSPPVFNETWLPVEGVEACRNALREMVPWLAEREFERTRICWYTDTPKGDFLIDYHPEYKGLFLVTGGSGHGFKFLPVMGGEVVKVLEGGVPEDSVRALWKWRKEPVDMKGMIGDGSRSGTPGLSLEALLKEERASSRL